MHGSLHSWADKKQCNSSIHQRSPHTSIHSHLRYFTVICETHGIKPMENGRQEESDPDKFAGCFLSGHFPQHVAHSRAFSSCSRAALQHLSFISQSDMFSPSVCKQKLVNTQEVSVRKLESVSQSCKCSQPGSDGICKAMVVVFVMLPALQLICHLFYQSPHILAFVSQPGSPAISYNLI